MVISLRVSVPVLSEHTTEAEPSVSTDDSRFTMAWRRAMRWTPRASTTERTAGNPSGTAATARDTPTSSTSTASLASSMSEVRKIPATTTRAMITTAIPSSRPRRETSRCSGVGSSSVLPNSRAIVPISVSMPGGGDHGPTPAAGHRGAAEHHVEPVPQPRGPGQGGRVLEHGLALAGERGLGHLERGGLDQAGVGGHGVALGQRQQVAGNDVGDGDALLPPVAHDARGGRGHALQGGHRLLGPRLLHVAQHRVGHDDGQDHDDLEGHLVGALQQPRHQRHDHGRDEQVDERVGELGQEAAPAGHGLGRPELVRAVAGQAGGRLGAVEPAPEVGAERARNGFGIAQPGLGRGGNRGQRHALSSLRLRLVTVVSVARRSYSSSADVHVW